MQVYKPTDCPYNCVGDGTTDDGPGINQMLEDIRTAGDAVIVDFSGPYTWGTDETINLELPAHSRVLAGHFRGLSKTGPVPLLRVFMKKSVIQGSMFIDSFNPTTSWYIHKGQGDAVHLDAFNTCVADGWKISGFTGWGIRHEPGPGNSIIGGNLGSVNVSKCGSITHSSVAHEKLDYTAIQITREGQGSNANQEALVELDSNDSLDSTIEVGDLVFFEGKPKDGGVICEITEIDTSVAGAHTLRVFPWPPDTDTHVFNGTGSWGISVVHGGGVKLSGSNTASSRIDILITGRCGTALDLNTLYAPLVGPHLAEACSCAFRLGKGNINAGILLMPHYEANACDYVERTSNSDMIVVQPTLPLLDTRDGFNSKYDPVYKLNATNLYGKFTAVSTQIDQMPKNTSMDYVGIDPGVGGDFGIRYAQRKVFELNANTANEVRALRKPVMVGQEISFYLRDDNSGAASIKIESNCAFNTSGDDVATLSASGSFLKLIGIRPDTNASLLEWRVVASDGVVFS